MNDKNNNKLWIIFIMLMLTGISVFSDNKLSGLILVAISLITVFPLTREYFYKSFPKKRKNIDIISTVILLIGIVFSVFFIENSSIKTLNDPKENVSENIKEDNSYKIGDIKNDNIQNRVNENEINKSEDETKGVEEKENNKNVIQNTENDLISLENLPSYSGEPYIIINDNIPDFTQEERTDRNPFEFYSDLDSLGRVGMAEGVLGKETMPKENEKRGKIGNKKPTGWQNQKYEIVSGKYLYNRCHLIGWQLSAENDNEKNLMTGTRYFNVDGMLPFENLVADYIKETNNHVRYRVKPYFKENNLVAHGLQIEARSIEDDGEGVEFNIYCYNVQPGIVINYSDGSNYQMN